MEKKRLVQGIYRVYDKDTGDSFVGFSYNVEGTIKRLRFELTLNACSYKPLQAFWNERGELSMELMEEYVPSEVFSEIEDEAHIKAMMFAAKSKLGESTRLIQTSI